MDRGHFADSTNWLASHIASRLALDVGQEFARIGIGPTANELPLMQATRDHYLLYTEAAQSGEHEAPRWKFVLQSVGSDERLLADDADADSNHNRLELLAVVRGLEAIDRPARVTLVTRSRYVSRGIRRQLTQWREQAFQWERFGKVVPIRDHDLWRRVDRALEFHRVECCGWSHEGHAEHASTRVASAPAQNTLIAAALATLRRGVLTPFSALLGPSYNRAA
jgi:ribonuclease HI